LYWYRPSKSFIGQALDKTHAFGVRESGSNPPLLRFIC